MAKKTIKVWNSNKLPTLPLDEFKEFQGNLKRLKDSEKKKLRKSIVTKGFRIPVFTWRKNILDGHQRLKVLGELVEDGYKLTPAKIPYVAIPASNESEAKQMLLVISSRYGEITKGGFQEFIECIDISLDELGEIVDLPEINIDSLTGADKEKTPEIEFTEELLESHNYVVLYFDNEIDWQNAKTLFGLKTVKALDSKPGYVKQGIGRVVRGVDAIERIRKEAKKQ